MRRFAGAAALAAACFLPAAGASISTDAALQSAALAWERGDYIAALTTYQDLLAGPDAERALEPIALQTGELYRTTELTSDGTAPQIAGNGRYATYETGAGRSRVTRLVALPAGTAAPGGVRQIAELHGYGAAFSLDGGRLAYLKVSPSPALAAAYAELERAPAAERNMRLAALNARSAAEAVITVRDLASGSETELKTDEMVKGSLVFGAGNVLLFAGASAAGGSPQQLYSIAEGRAATALTTGAGDKAPVLSNSSGDRVVMVTRGAGGAARGAGAGGRRRSSGRWTRRHLQRAGGRRRQGRAAQHHRPAVVLRRRQVARVRGARRRRLQGGGRACCRRRQGGHRAQRARSGSRRPRSRPTAAASPTR